METPDEQEPDRRDRRLIAACAVISAGVIVGVVVVARSPQAGAKVAEFGARTRGVFGRPLTDAVVHASNSALAVEPTELVDMGGRVAGQLVRGHTRMQAYGPDWSMHRLISVASYLRAAPVSA